MQAIILAGGFGSRLKAVLGDAVPKPMAPIGGEPFLAHYLRYLQQQGVTGAILCVHHLKERIIDHFGEQFEGMPIRYTVEARPLGTGGAIRQALALLTPGDAALVINGDSYIELDFARMMESHRASGAGLTIALRAMKDCSRYGQAMLDSASTVASFVYPGHRGEGWVSLGAYIMNRDLFRPFRLPEAFSFESDFKRPYCERVRPHAWLSQGYFIDIGVPEDYARAVKELPARIARPRAAAS